jgi:hypothetical protein
MATNPEFLSDTLIKSVFRVPLYQRGYSWRENHVLELLNDIDLCDVGQEPIHHFVNSFIGKKVEEIETNQAHRPIYELTDGQQRMTTLYLILVRLLKRLEEMQAEEDDIASINSRLWVKPINQPKISRLTFQEPSRQNFWNELICDLDPDATFSSENRLVEAVEVINDFLLGKTLAELNLYRRKILTGCSCVLVDYATATEAGTLNLNEHTVFATLNSRGLNVAAFDMIKNLGLMIKSSNANHVNANFLPNQTWKRVLKYLDSKDAEKMELKMVTSYYRIIENNTDIDKKGTDLFQQFYKKYSSLQFPLNGRLTNDQTQLFTSVQDFFASMEDFAKSYVSIHQSTYTKGLVGANQAYLDKVSECNILLTEINHKNGLSMTLLNDILVCSHSKYTIDEFMPILEKISPILMRVYSGTGSKRVDHLTSNHLNAANGVWTGDTKAVTIAYLCNVLSNANNNGGLNQFILRLHSEIGKDAYAWSNITYFLFEYEMSLNPAWAITRTTLSPKSRTVEHIMPKAWQPVAYWETLYNSNAIGDAMVKRLGNLVLTGDNTQLSNRSFPEKRDGAPPGIAPYYSHALSLKGENFVAALGVRDWEKKQIAIREIFLLWFAFHRWKTDCACDQGISFSFPQEILLTFGIGTMQDLIDGIIELEGAISEFSPDEGAASVENLVERLNEIVEEEE